MRSDKLLVPFKADALRVVVGPTLSALLPHMRHHQPLLVVKVCQLTSNAVQTTQLPYGDRAATTVCRRTGNAWTWPAVGPLRLHRVQVKCLAATRFRALLVAVHCVRHRRRHPYRRRHHNRHQRQHLRRVRVDSMVRLVSVVRRVLAAPVATASLATAHAPVSMGSRALHAMHVLLIDLVSIVTVFGKSLFLIIWSF